MGVVGGDWDGWGLFHAVTGEKTCPERLIKEGLVPKSGWELNCFAIMNAKTQIGNDGKYVVEPYQDVSGIDPQLWVSDESGKLYWGILRHVISQTRRAEMPVEAIRKTKELTGRNGFFANLMFMPYDGFDGIYRDELYYFDFDGLEEA